MRIKDIKLLLNNHPYWKKLPNKSIALVRAYQLLINNPKEDLKGQTDNCPKQFFEPFRFFSYDWIDNQLRDHLYELDKDSRKVIYQIAQQKVANWRNSRNDTHYKIATYKEENIFSKVVHQISQKLSIIAFMPERISKKLSISQRLSLITILAHITKAGSKSIAQRLELSLISMLYARSSNLVSEIVKSKKIAISQRLSLISGWVGTFRSKIIAISQRLALRTMATEDLYTTKTYSSAQRLSLSRIAS